MNRHTQFILPRKHTLNKTLEAYHTTFDDEMAKHPYVRHYAEDNAEILHHLFNLANTMVNNRKAILIIILPKSDEEYYYTTMSILKKINGFVSTYEVARRNIMPILPWHNNKWIDTYMDPIYHDLDKIFTTLCEAWRLPARRTSTMIPKNMQAKFYAAKFGMEMRRYIGQFYEEGSGADTVSSMDLMPARMPLPIKENAAIEVSKSREPVLKNQKEGANDSKPVANESIGAKPGQQLRRPKDEGCLKCEDPKYGAKHCDLHGPPRPGKEQTTSTEETAETNAEGDDRFVDARENQPSGKSVAEVVKHQRDETKDKMREMMEVMEAGAKLITQLKTEMAGNRKQEIPSPMDLEERDPKSERTMEKTT